MLEYLVSVQASSIVHGSACKGQLQGLLSACEIGSQSRYSISVWYQMNLKFHQAGAGVRLAGATRVTSSCEHCDVYVGSQISLFSIHKQVRG